MKIRARHAIVCTAAAIALVASVSTVAGADNKGFDTDLLDWFLADSDNVNAAQDQAVVDLAKSASSDGPALAFTAKDQDAAATASVSTNTSGSTSVSSSNSTATLSADSASHLASYVTDDMCEAEYWLAKTTKRSVILQDKAGIAAVNQSAMSTSACSMYDLASMTTFNGITLKDNLNYAMYVSGYYLWGETTTLSDSYKQALSDNMDNATLYGGTQPTGTDQYAYGIITKRADMFDLPTTDHLGYSSDDTDNENQLSASVVGEPFLVALVTADGKFAYGYSQNCHGWIPADCVAICADKTQWLNAWQTGMDITSAADNILIVTCGKIFLDYSLTQPETSALELSLGTILRLVPEADVPKAIKERDTANTIVAYIPTRADDGSYVQSIALIAQHYEYEGLVHIGYIDYTQENILNIAYNCLGDRYGWGGMYHQMDCSSFVQQLFRCFGYYLPRNTTWQVAIPNVRIDLYDKTDAEKCAILDTLPVGTILYLGTGAGVANDSIIHEMIYLGHVDDQYFVFNDAGFFYDAITNTACAGNNVMINTLSVKRGSGKTWLACLYAAINFADADAIAPTDISTCAVTLSSAADKMPFPRGTQTTADSDADDAATDTTAVPATDTTATDTTAANSDLTVTYTGSPITPEIQVCDGPAELTYGTDYELAIADNIHAGTATVTISGIGDYTGTTTATFTIAPAETSVIAADYTGGFDNTAHTFTLRGVQVGSTVEFQVQGASTWTTEKPARVSVGTTTVNWRITHPDYQTITGTNTITINNNPTEKTVTKTVEKYIYVYPSDKGGTSGTNSGTSSGTSGTSDKSGTSGTSTDSKSNASNTNSSATDNNDKAASDNKDSDSPTANSNSADGSSNADSTADSDGGFLSSVGNALLSLVKNPAFWIILVIAVVAAVLVARKR